MKALKIIFIFLFILFFANAEVWAQCAMCRASVESSASSGSNIVAGLNAGIIYLATIPYLMIGGLIYFWYRHSKRPKIA